MNRDTSILVTGGTGFVGSYLLRWLLQCGYTRIRAIRRTDSQMDLVADIQHQIEWLQGDILDIAFLDFALEGVRQIYHCAALVSHEPRDADQMRQINSEGTARVVNACLEIPDIRLVYMSSIAAVGREKNFQRLSEQSKWVRSPLNSNYAISKYLAEQEVWRGMAEGLNGAMLNPAVILGGGFWDRGTPQLFQRVHRGMTFYPVGGTGFVDVRDVARAAVLLMESDIHSRRFILSAADLSYQDLFSKIATQLEVKPPTNKASPWMANSLATVSAGWNWLTGRSLGVSAEAARLASLTFYYDAQRSREELSLHYTTIDQTIRETAVLCQQAAEKNWSPAILPFSTPSP